VQFTRKISFFLFSLLLTIASACHPKSGHNQYREAKVRPSERQMKADKKHNKEMEKAYKKQMRKNRKKLFGSPVDPHGPKK
jgi:hypothetical protein